MTVKGQNFNFHFSFTENDPSEDTERGWEIEAEVKSRRFTENDPSEDTESPSATARGEFSPGGFTENDPSEDTESST